jgi:hypothetical protein
VTSGGPDLTRIEFRVPAREGQAALLRAQLRLWLLANDVGDETDVFEILASATRAFLLALWRPGPLRTMTLEIAAHYDGGVVELSVHDHAGREGNTVRFGRLLAPRRAGGQPVVVG